MFSRRELRTRRSHSAAHRVGKVGRRERAWRHGRVAGCRHDVVRRRVLGNERRCSGLERLEQLLVAGIHRQHHDAHLRARPCAGDRTRSRPVPSGRRTSVTTTEGLSRGGHRRPSATGPASPTTEKSLWRSKARASPWRIRSWSSTSSDGVRRLGHHQPSPCRITRHRAAWPSVTVTQRPRAAFSGAVAGDVQRRTRPICPLAHDLDAIGVISRLT